MPIVADATLLHPRPVVFAAYRDELARVVPLLPDVRAIEAVSREQDGPRTRVVSVWRGGGEIPAVARSLVSPSMLAWTDDATWDEDAWTCTWRVETHAFTEAIDCRGQNRFVAIDGGSRLEIRGEVRIDARKVKGVPSMLAGRVASAAEAYLAGRIGPNALVVARALERWLDARGDASR